MPTNLRISLQGGDAQLGDVPAVDVANLIIGIETAVARAASQLVGRKGARTGRRVAVVEAATRLRLVGVEAGSVVPVLTLPEPLPGIDELPVEIESLGEQAWNMALATLRGEESDPEVADAFLVLAERIGIGTKYESISLEGGTATNGRSAAVLDANTRTRLNEVVTQSVARRRDAVAGTLFEADFEKNTAKLRTARRRVVTVSFDEQLADEIQRVLRNQAELVGRVTYDENTGEALKIEVQRAVRTEQLLIDPGDADYWHHQSVNDLIEERDAPPATSAEQIRDMEANNDEVDAFLAAISDR